MIATGDRRTRVLELRSVRGTGGGPEKTILFGTAQSSRDRFDITVCYVRDLRDGVFAIDEWASQVGVPYVEVHERHSFDPRIWSALRTLVKERKIDIVHAHDYKTDVVAWLLGIGTHVIPLSTVHGWTGHSWRERKVYYPADKRVLARFPHLVAVSEDIRQELIRSGAKPDRVTTVLNGIDASRFSRQPQRGPSIRAELGLSPGDLVIGAVGRLEPQKRFDLLIETFLTVAATRDNLKLVIVGDGSRREELERLVALSERGRQILLLGHRTDVADLHNAFDLLVQSSDYEGTPNAVLEAMALETPIVATAAGGTSQIARHGLEALIVPAGDRLALGRAIGEALDDEAAARTRARAARHRVETDLSFRARMGRLETIYDQVMAERARATS